MDIVLTFKLNLTRFGAEFVSSSLRVGSASDIFWLQFGAGGVCGGNNPFACLDFYFEMSNRCKQFPICSFILEDFQKLSIDVSLVSEHAQCISPASVVISNITTGSRTILHMNRCVCLCVSLTASVFTASSSWLSGCAPCWLVSRSLLPVRAFILKQTFTCPVCLSVCQFHHGRLLAACDWCVGSCLAGQRSNSMCMLCGLSVQRISNRLPLWYVRGPNPTRPAAFTEHYIVRGYHGDNRRPILSVSWSDHQILRVLPPGGCYHWVPDDLGL